MKDADPRVGVFVLIFVLLFEMAHDFIRTGAVGSITEELGKLLVASAVSLGAAAMMTDRSSGLRMWVFGLAIASLVIIFVQANIYDRQRTQTRQYLAELIADRKPDTLQDRGNLTGRLVGEVVDADFMPESVGNFVSGYQRDETRKMVAEWLTQVMKIPCTKDELLVPEHDRRWVYLYNFLGIIIVTITLIYFGILVYAGRQASSRQRRDRPA